MSLNPLRVLPGIALVVGVLFMSSTWGRASQGEVATLAGKTFSVIVANTQSGWTSKDCIRFLQGGFLQIDILNPAPTGGFTEQPGSEDTLKFIGVQQPYG